MKRNKRPSALDNGPASIPQNDYGWPEGQYPYPPSSADYLDSQSAYGARRFNRTLRSKRKEGQYRRSYWRTWVIALAVALLLIVLIPTFVFSVEPVDGDSMLPTLRSGEQLLINKIALSLSPPQRYDIVVCHYPGRKELFVKRVVALPGETMEIKSGVIWINGQPLDESAYQASAITEDMLALTIPKGHVFVVGDNRAVSMDSRNVKVGCIPYRLLVGRASLVLFPLSGIRAIY